MHWPFRGENQLLSDFLLVRLTIHLASPSALLSRHALSAEATIRSLRPRRGFYANRARIDSHRCPQSP
jgi:hypothetical protein